MRTLGGNVGQRERILLVTMAYTILAGVLAHYGMGPDATAALTVTGGAIGVVGSYTYKASATTVPVPPTGTA